MEGVGGDETQRIMGRILCVSLKATGYESGKLPGGRVVGLDFESTVPM